MDFEQYLTDKICHCDLMNGYYCNHRETVTTALALANVNSENSERTDTILTEARQIIDELLEQNKIMRKIMQMIIADYASSDGIDLRSCAWCGIEIELDSDNIYHEKDCLIETVKVLLPTIPEIK